VVRNDSVICDTAKIIVKDMEDDHVLIATSGVHSLLGLARHALNLPQLPDPNDAEDCDRWAHAVACALAELAVDAKPPLVDDGRVDGEALLAFDRHLWLLNGPAAIRLYSAFAIGSGAPEARGALHALGRFGHQQPQMDVVAAVKAAIDLDPNCGGAVMVAHTLTTTDQDQ